METVPNCFNLFADDHDIEIEEDVQGDAADPDAGDQNLLKETFNSNNDGQYNTHSNLHLLNRQFP